jgi:multidrug efflux system outer membrane protein
VHYVLLDEVHVAAERPGSLTANAVELFCRWLDQGMLDGIIGLAGSSLATTFSPTGLLWAVGAGLVAPIFEGGRLASQEEASWANLEQAVALYRQQVITAWREVSDAAISVRKLGEVAAQLEVQVTAATTAERLARLRYDGGVSNYLEVLDAQRSLFNSELALAQINRDQLVALVQLYKALGGGWQDRVPVDPATQPVPAGTPGPTIPPTPAAPPAKG